MEYENNTQPEFEQPGFESKGRTDYFLPLSILVSGILIAGSIVYMVTAQRPITGGSADNNNNQQAAADAAAAPAPVPSANGKSVTDIRSRDVVLGNTKAPVTLIEYGDYQCPFCVRFNQTTEPPLRQNDIKNGNVNMIFRNFAFLGAESTAAAEAAECAKDQNKFWAYHDALYNAEAADEQKNPTSAENNGSYTRALFLQLASQAGLDAGKFTTCIDTGKYKAQVAADAQDAQALGVNSTPTLFLNGQKILGAVPYDGDASSGMTPLKTLIQQALKK
jgi:protein-disulfide isomerase